MPRKKKSVCVVSSPKKASNRPAKLGNWRDEAMTGAIEAVKGGMGVNRAAKEFGVPTITSVAHGWAQYSLPARSYTADIGKWCGDVLFSSPYDSQPLDVGFFHPLKVNWHNMCHEWVDKNPKQGDNKVYIFEPVSYSMATGNDTCQSNGRLQESWCLSLE
jgi:hypothetical protein